MSEPNPERELARSLEITAAHAREVVRAMDNAREFENEFYRRIAVKEWPYGFRYVVKPEMRLSDERVMSWEEMARCANWLAMQFPRLGRVMNWILNPLAWLMSGLSKAVKRKRYA